MVALTIRSAGIGSQNACEFVALPPDEYFTRSEKKFSPPPGTPTATCQYVPPAWLLLIPTQANTRIPAAVAGTTLSGILKRCTTPAFIGRFPRIAARFSPGWTAIQGPTPLIDRSPFGSIKVRSCGGVRQSSRPENLYGGIGKHKTAGKVGVRSA